MYVSHFHSYQGMQSLAHGRSTGGAQAEHRHGAGGSNWIELLAALLSTVANLLIYAIYRDFMGRESSQIISNHLKSCCLKPIAAGQPHFTFNSFNSFCSLHRDSRPFTFNSFCSLHRDSSESGRVAAWQEAPCASAWPTHARKARLAPV